MCSYPAAAEEDIRRWERSYMKLSPDHMTLLPHMPEKYENLRRCVKTNTYFIMNMLQAFDPPFEMDAGPGPDFDEALSGFQKSDKMMHSHEGFGCRGREDESTIEVQSFSSPSRDSAVTSANSNKRQAIEFSAKDPKTDLLTPELNAFGTRGPVRSCDDWTCTRSEALSKEHNAAAGANGNLSYDETDYESTFKENSENGHPSGSPKLFPQGRVPLDLSHPFFQLHVPSADVDKVRCIIRNIVRDWGEEGSLEREQCYQPILEELHRLFPNRKDLRHRPTCLVPGAGLGRLACEISRLGFIAQGNEFSYYMLICSSFILNQTDQPLEWALHPWMHSNCNSLSDNDQLRAVYIPDLHPGSAGITEGFSMCAGDFVEVYSHPSQAGAWDAVATCFFIDTAHNIVEYLEVIALCLKPGGIWINLGPLLYHFAESYSPEEEMSIELSLEDVKKVAARFGLVLKSERFIETTYTANRRSMMQNRYTAVFWTMVKEELPPNQKVSQANMPDAQQ
ncbi:uncharacterized protein [Physcomitrium patens]|uniref:uncharacterized protein isoform X2 n=1 Tax=Physcomitrium patens TaxID=3218 RepID=UPI000D154A31|nr:carnosine N-methyltransferase-like isoform X2 [Physcomitrium patens]|eukprot:XP_024401463.1 carnosine N-methyltransferase-like isoform X2 [Physcomitrella patens]